MLTKIVDRIHGKFQARIPVQGTFIEIGILRKENEEDCQRGQQKSTFGETLLPIALKIGGRKVRNEGRCGSGDEPAIPQRTKAKKLAAIMRESLNRSSLFPPMRPRRTRRPPKELSEVIGQPEGERLQLDNDLVGVFRLRIQKT